MLELHDMPDDLQTCQQLLRELSAAYDRLQHVYDELLATCTSIQDSQLKLEQEKDELELTIKELMNRLYGRRSERHKASPDQLPLDFGDGDAITTIPDVSEDEGFDSLDTSLKMLRKLSATSFLLATPTLLLLMLSHELFIFADRCRYRRDPAVGKEEGVRRTC